MWLRCLLSLSLRLVCTALLGGLLGATLVRFAPGFSVDERELDPRFSAPSLEAIRGEQPANTSVFSYYASYLSGLTHGDLGESRTFRRPVTSLFGERLPVTLKSVALGLLLAWTLGLSLALPSAGRTQPGYELLVTLSTGLLLCLPSALIAVFFLYWGGLPALPIALVVFPRVARYSRNLVTDTASMPHVLCAQAKGVSRAGILLRHILPVAAPQLLALTGVSLSMALGAAIPIEVICDSPGIGQLAWQAALGRDLPVLVNVTLLVTLATLAANSAAEFAGKSFLRQVA